MHLRSPGCFPAREGSSDPKSHFWTDCEAKRCRETFLLLPRPSRLAWRHTLTSDWLSISTLRWFWLSCLIDIFWIRSPWKASNWRALLVSARTSRLLKFSWLALNSSINDSSSSIVQFSILRADEQTIVFLFRDIFEEVGPGKAVLFYRFSQKSLFDHCVFFIGIHY